MDVMRSGIYKLILMFGICAWSATAGAEIYKWRDARGVMNYSDTPPSADVLQSQKIKPAVVPADWPLTRADTYRPADSAAEAQKKPSDTKPVRDAANAAANEQADAAEALKAMQEKSKAQNCASARTNYRNYAIGGRMQNVNELGEKEFMNDQQIQEGLMRAQQQIDENCPPE